MQQKDNNNCIVSFSGTLSWGSKVLVVGGPIPSFATGPNYYSLHPPQNKQLHDKFSSSISLKLYPAELTDNMKTLSTIDLVPQCSVYGDARDLELFQWWQNYTLYQGDYRCRAEHKTCPLSSAELYLVRNMWSSHCSQNYICDSGDVTGTDKKNKPPEMQGHLFTDQFTPKWELGGAVL